MRAASALLIIALLARDAASAEKPSETIIRNSDAVVYLEVTDSKGGVVDHGTGFVVSHDGFVVTAAHIKVDSTEKLWAVIGQRQGVRYTLSFRDEDESSDVALWQLPASSSCRKAVTISSTPVKLLDRVLVLGFPADQDLSPASVGITNLSSTLGFYKADGMLQPGNSGGPVFDEDGNVVGEVQGGTLPGSDNNDIVPVATAVALLRKHAVQFGIGAPVAFDEQCYATCRIPQNGIESWGVSRPWGPKNTGWLGGGHGEESECNALIAADIANGPGAHITLSPGSAGMWEKSRKDLFGHVEYQYFCAGTFQSNPIYRSTRSEACGLR